MKNYISYILILSSIFMGGIISSCSDDDNVLKNPLKSPTTSLDAQSYNYLSFSWERIDKAIQYGYVLTSASSSVVGEGTTVNNSVSFSGLLPNTEYTLQVWAFPSLQSDFSSSPAFSLTAKTDPLKSIDAPQPVASQSGTKISISWEEIENASFYSYTLIGPGIEDPEQIDTEETSISFVGLELGNYEFEIFANSNMPGYESKSDKTSIIFTVEPLKDWRVRCNGYYGYWYTQKSFYTTLAYNNSTDVYTVESWCGVAGYDISFQITENGMELYGIEKGSNGYYIVETGLENPSYLNVYTSDGYSYMDGSMEEGEIWIGCYDPDWTTWDYNGYVWDQETSHPSIDEICGTYSYSDWGYEYYTSWGTWNEFSYSDQVCTISKLDDDNVWISTLLSYPGFEECGFQAEYVPQTMTLKVPIQNYAEYYVLAFENDDYTSGSEPTEGIIAYVMGDGTISMENWVVYYNYSGWWYKYFCYTGSLWSPSKTNQSPFKSQAKFNKAPNRKSPK